MFLIIMLDKLVNVYNIHVQYKCMYNESIKMTEIIKSPRTKARPAEIMIR